MKLLFFDFDIPYLLRDEDYPVGGACVRQYALGKGIIELGHQVGFLTWKGAKEYVGKDIEFDLVETYPLIGGIRKLRWFYKRFPSLVRAVNEYNPDFLIKKGRKSYTGVMAFISDLFKIPFVYMATNDIDADSRYKKNLNLIEQIIYKFGLRRARAIFSQNSYQYKKFKKVYSQRIFLMHNPYFFKGRLPKIKDYSKRKYIAWLGIYQYQKNLTSLYKVVKKLSNFEFRIAGKASKNLDKDTRYALVQLKKCKNIKFVGYLRRAEIIPFLSNAYALINTSYYEGFSNVFLEAFAAGTPVVTTSKVDPDNIIAKNNIGLVAENYNEIPKLIISLINSKDYDSIAQRCRNYVVKNHNPRKIATMFIENLKSIDTK
ncbi:MAG: glycosyltransferase family 4 protein [Promethearchaeota archaeon]